MGPQSVNVDRVIARIAARSKGIVSRRELLKAGVGSDAIKGRIRRGTLIPEHAGVYRVGHSAPSTEASYMAAVKACGGSAALAGMAAAHWMGLVKGRPPTAEVVAPTGRDVAGVITRRSRRIERWTFNGIPTTTVARTLVDIAKRLDDDYQLGNAVHEAQVRYGTTPKQVEQVLKHRFQSPGAKRLRRTIRGDTHISLSALERKFLQRLREAGLPLPDQTNKVAGAYRVDCRRIKQKLTVELDSYRFHNTRHAFEQDRKRERDAYARGDDFRRYTWGDVYEHPEQMLAELRELLA